MAYLVHVQNRECVYFQIVLMLLILCFIFWCIHDDGLDSGAGELNGKLISWQCEIVKRLFLVSSPTFDKPTYTH